MTNFMRQLLCGLMGVDRLPLDPFLLKAVYMAVIAVVTVLAIWILAATVSSLLYPVIGIENGCIYVGWGSTQTF